MILGGQFSYAYSKGPLLDLGGKLIGGSYTEVINKVNLSAK